MNRDQVFWNQHVKFNKEKIFQTILCIPGIFCFWLKHEILGFFKGHSSLNNGFCAARPTYSEPAWKADSNDVFKRRFLFILSIKLFRRNSYWLPTSSFNDFWKKLIFNVYFNNFFFKDILTFKILLLNNSTMLNTILKKE